MRPDQVEPLTSTHDALADERAGSLARLVETTVARAGIGFVTAAPGAPIPVRTPIRVTADLTVGTSPWPYYLLLRPTPGTSAGGISVSGSVHIILADSEGDDGDAATKF
jgi:hypothetical protein